MVARLLCALSLLLAGILPMRAQADAPADTARPAAKRGSLVARFLRLFEDYDTAYIAPARYNFTAMAQTSATFQSYRLSGFQPDGTRQSLSFAPQPSLRVGPYFGWRWLFLGYTFDVGHMGNRQLRREFNLSLYSALLGCDPHLRQEQRRLPPAPHRGLRRRSSRRLQQPAVRRPAQPHGLHPRLLHLQPPPLLLPRRLQPDHRTAAQLRQLEGGFPVLTPTPQLRPHAPAARPPGRADRRAPRERSALQRLQPQRGLRLQLGLRPLLAAGRLGGAGHRVQADGGRGQLRPDVPLQEPELRPHHARRTRMEQRQVVRRRFGRQPRVQLPPPALRPDQLAGLPEHLRRLLLPPQEAGLKP